MALPTYQAIRDALDQAIRRISPGPEYIVKTRDDAVDLEKADTITLNNLSSSLRNSMERAPVNVPDLLTPEVKCTVKQEIRLGKDGYLRSVPSAFDSVLRHRTSLAPIGIRLIEQGMMHHGGELALLNEMQRIRGLYPDERLVVLMSMDLSDYIQDIYRSTNPWKEKDILVVSNVRRWELNIDNEHFFSVFPLGNIDYGFYVEYAWNIERVNRAWMVKTAGQLHSHFQIIPVPKPGEAAPPPKKLSTSSRVTLIDDL